MIKYTWENPPVNGIKHEKEYEIKEYIMFPPGVFQHETEHHYCYDFVRGVKETSSVINEFVKLHPHVYYGKNAHSYVEGGYDNIEFKSKTWIWQLVR